MAVSLASNNNLLPVPAPSVLVPANATSTVFSATAGNIAANQGATLSASLSGASQTVTINLVAAPPVMLSSLVCSPTSLATGAATSCIVTLSKAAPNGGTVVGLASNNTLLPVPAASVTVPANATSTTFTVTAGQIQEPQLANLTVTLSGGGSIQFGVNLLTQVIPLSLTCTPRMLWSGGTTVCTVTLSQAAPVGVTWSLSPATGTLSTGGGVAVYAAPAIINSSQTVNVTATSMADPTKSVTSVITLIPAVIMSLSPSSANLEPGQTQQFTASVTGTTNTAVTWSLSPAVGTIDSTGLYTAPASVTSAQTVTVTAQSAAAPTTKASATVSLLPGVQFTISDMGLTSLSYNGQSYYLALGNSPVVGHVIFLSPGGTETDVGYPSPLSAVKSTGTNPSYFQHIYNHDASYSYTVKAVYTTPNSRTLKVDAYVTNNDPLNTLERISLYLPDFQTPGPATQFSGGAELNVNPVTESPVQVLSGTWGSIAYWLGDYSKYSQTEQPYGSSGQIQFFGLLENFFGRRYQATRTKYYEATIAPGQTEVLTFYLRFGGPTDTAATLAPDAFEAFRNAYPSLVTWTNKAPIGEWFIASDSSTSATNPRGYLRDPTIDVSNTANFNSQVLNEARQIVARMNSITPRPQGIVVWDLEGEEFSQPFSYVGNPPMVPLIAPEMDAVADQMFATFTNAGYLVGMTLRPQTFMAGSQLPSTCQTGTVTGQQDVFILTTATWPYRGYECSAPNTWTQPGAHLPSFQTTLDDDDAIVSQLKTKVAYAHTRWGARLFYVDSAVYLHGDALVDLIFRSLQQQFPDCLFMPEEYTPYHPGATAPYGEPALGVLYTPPAWKQIYPNAFSAINAAHADLVNQYSALLRAVQSGDLMLFPAWVNSPEIPVIEQLYATAGK